MKFGIAIYSNADSNKMSIISALEQRIKDYLAVRDYGVGIKDYVIGIICMSPEFEPHWSEDRKKYTKSKKLLEYGIMLSYSQFENATEKEIEELFVYRLLNSLGVIDELKIKNFDTNKFREDLMMFFKENGIQCDKGLVPAPTHLHVSEVKEHNNSGNRYLELLHEKLDKQGKISLLSDLITKNKFASEEWEIRGLGPSAPEISGAMNQLINEIIDELIVAIQADVDDDALKQTIIKECNKLDECNFDTEELEFLCDWYEALARLADIDIHKELNKCLYGELGELL